MKTAIGLMSGTSMDGIDVALVETDGQDRIEFGPSLAIDYPSDMRRKLEAGLVDALEIEQRSDRPRSLAGLELEITRSHASAVDTFLHKFSLSRSDVDMIGFHGQTALHRPEIGLTVQLGDGAALARQTGIDVVYDMRARDMVESGQGAPLVPVFHRALANGLTCKSPVCFVNIGGISNISYVDEDDLCAFDCGPGNTLIDQFVQAKGGIPYDQGGRIASEGQVIIPVVEGYMATEYFEKPGPKSLDRGDFPPLEPTRAELSDGARSLAHVTARSIIKSADHLSKPPGSYILCGGGRLNDTIVSDLTQLAAEQGAAVMRAEDVKLDGDMLEAQAFGYLAVRSQLGLPLTFPTTTGCRTPVTGGVHVKAGD